MTGGWAVVGVAAVGFNGHSVRCLVRLVVSMFTCRRILYYDAPLQASLLLYGIFLDVSHM